MRLTKQVLKQNTDFKVVMMLVLHRHGDRAPIRELLYPSSLSRHDDFFPIGESNLTILGKQQMYNVGLELRKRYNKFLGPLYLPNEIETFTSNILRTKMSVLLVCAGLFPPAPKQKWNERLNWQPIPYIEIPVEKDCIIRSPSADRFPAYDKLYKQTLQNNFAKELLNKYSSELNYLEEHTGHKNISLADVYNICHTLTAELSMGKPLPNWAKEVGMRKLEEIGVNEYKLMTHTIELKKYCGGGLAKKIVNECEKKIKENSAKKCVIFSGHETTVAFQLLLLDIFNDKIPPLAAYIIWELLEKDSKYFIRVLYQDYVQNEPKQCKFLPWDDFVELVSPTFPNW